jgi:uncharacterized Tic20 family protein
LSGGGLPGEKGERPRGERGILEGTSPEAISPSSPSQEDRNWATLAHASILLAPWTGVGGVIAALLIWATRRGSSPYVARQSLQAWTYQLMVPALLAAVGLLAFLSPESAIGGYRRGLIVFGLAVLLPALVGYGCYSAYTCSQGRDFKYLVIGWLITRRSNSSH